MKQIFSCFSPGAVFGQNRKQILVETGTLQSIKLKTGTREKCELGSIIIFQEITSEQNQNTNNLVTMLVRLGIN